MFYLLYLFVDFGHVYTYAEQCDASTLEAKPEHLKGIWAKPDSLGEL